MTFFCFKTCSRQKHHKADDETAPSSDAAAASGHAMGDPNLKLHEEPNGTTSALIETFLPFILPIIRVAISKQLLQDGCVLRDEIRVPVAQNPQPNADKNMDESLLPIGPIEINIGHILLMDSKTVIKDMKGDSKFHWPEKDFVDELMKVVPGYGRKMIVMDFCDFQCQIPLGQGIELAFPLELPLMGSNLLLEVGSGKGVPHPWVKLMVPKMRIWFVTTTRKLYVAFMDRPQLIPNLHVNLDRGKGDFLDFVLKEDGSLDDVVETVLCSFGPKNFVTSTKKKSTRAATGTSTTTSRDLDLPKNHNNNKTTNLRGGKDSSSNGSSTQHKKAEDSTEAVGTTSWVGNALGGIISRIMLQSMSKTGDRCPLEIDLSEMIESSLDAMMGIPRPVDVIKADIARLEKELEEATKASQQATTGTTNQQQQQQQQQQQRQQQGDKNETAKAKSNAWSLF